MTSPFDQLIQQLQSPDPEQRKQAIIALANSKSPGALQPLAAIYRSDPDPALRDLALKAGRYIRQSEGAGAAWAASTAQPAASTSRPASRPASQPRSQSTEHSAQEQPQTSERDREFAKNLLDSATDFHIEGDSGRAIENLGKALALNPDLLKETFVQNLIMTLTGMSAQQALPVLTHPDRREQLILKVGGKRALKRQQMIDGRAIEDMSWNRILVDLGIYWIVTVISSVIMLFFMLDLIKDVFTEAGGENIFWYTFLNELETTMSDNVLRIILSSLVQSIGTTFTTVILLLVIHYTAVLFFGGDGTMEYLFRRAVPFLTVFTGGMTVALIVFLLINSSLTVWFLVPLVMAGGVAGMFVYLADLVGKVYNFGWISGCISVVLGAFIFGALWNILAYGLGAGMGF